MRTLWAIALLAACNGGDNGTDSGSGGLTAPEVSTDPAETARSDQDVHPVIVTPSEGASEISYAYSWLSDGGVAWPQEVLPATTTTKGEVWSLAVSPSGSGLTGPAGTTTVTIVNGPPTLSAAELSPSVPTVGTELTCLPVGADDPDGDSLTFTYAWERGGTALSTTSNTLPASEVLTGQTITCYVTPNDGEVDGNTVSVSGAATNAPPTASGSTITPSSPRSTDALTCTGSGGADPDGDTVTFLSYAWSINGTAVSETSNTLPASAIAKDDVVICTAIPYDGAANGTGTPSASVTVGNGLPVVTQVLISPSNATSEDTLACTPSGTDPDNDTLTWTYEWYVGGTLQSETSNFLPPGTAGAGASVTCTATAHDGTDSASLSSGTLTIANTPPTVSGVAITPANANGRQALTCSYASTNDPDGQTVTVSYAWTLDGNAAGTGATLPADTGIKGQVAACIATPNDGITDGNAVSAQLTFTNAPPDQPTVGITPTTANSTNTLTCAATPATDYDGDGVTYTYTWFIGATQVGTGATLSSGLAFRDDVVRCEAVPNDGTADGQMGQATITIGNTAPTASTPSLTPTTAYETTTLSCGTTLDDVDGDGTTATYRWTVAGGDVSPTGATLTGTYFNRGNAVQCHATPSDGDLTGTEVHSNTVTIQNSAPTQPVLALRPQSTTAGTEPLVCRVSTESSDADPADQGNLTYTFGWTRDGSTYTGATATTVYAGDTIPAGSVTVGSWSCTAFATDLDNGTSGTATGGPSTVVSTPGGGNTDVLVIYDVTSPDLMAALQQAGLNPSYSAVPENQWDGTNPSPASFGAVVHLNGTTYNLPMPVSGQTALVDYVQSGGGFVHFEWNAYETDLCGANCATDPTPGLREITLFDRTSASSSQTYTEVASQSGHPILAHVPASFAVPAGSFNVGPIHAFSTQPSTVLMNDSGSPAVATRQFGSGRVVGFNHSANWSNGNPWTDANVAAITADAVIWAAGLDLATNGLGDTYVPEGTDEMVNAQRACESVFGVGNCCNDGCGSCNMLGFHQCGAPNCNGSTYWNYANDLQSMGCGWVDPNEILICTDGVNWTQ